MVDTIKANVSNYPCTVCMGFCLEDENCIQCDTCINWFHKECVNLSNERFRYFLNNSNAKFTCTICVENKKCEGCEKHQDQSRVRFLYCVTCLKHFCDDCNPFLSDQINIYRSTDEPFYCPSCSSLYPCNVCSKHCYQDAVHTPFISCHNCDSRVHTKCSKLTRGQLNRIRVDNSKENLYLCNICRSSNLPFINLPQKTFQDNIQAQNLPKKLSQNTKPHLLCTLCTQCNTECEECIV